MKSNAQTIKNYETDWKGVATNIEKGLPDSALEIVKRIYTKAKLEKQEAQVVKALIYMNNLQEDNRENNELASITELEKEITTSKEPVTSLLKSYLAGVYQNYFNRNRYKLYSRTNTTNFEKNDPETWTIDDFTKKISTLYLQSISNEKLLQQTNLTGYDALIEKGNVRYLRPTMYDLLAHRALDYFKSTERSVTKPAYAFEINETEAFLPAAAFATQKFETKDSLSLQHKALLLYRDLIRFHLKDAKPEALIDVDLERLQYVQQNAIIADKNALYYMALEKITQKYPGNAAATQVWYLMAAWHYEQANQESNKKDTTDTNLAKAKEILLKITNADEKSEGVINGRNLLKQILQPDLSFQLEKANLPELPFRMLVTYKNVSTIYIRIVKATSALKKLVQDPGGQEKYWSAVAAATPLNAWEQQLPASEDNKQHQTEIKMNGLPIGEYYIFTSAAKNFDASNNILNLQLTYISNISFVNTDKDFFVLHRNTGQPLSNAQVTVWQKQYNYTTSKNISTKISSLQTDKNGHFTFALGTSDLQKRNRTGNYLFDISHNGEDLFMDDGNTYYYYNTYRQQPKQLRTSVFFFTDRSIYRPGQTIYFKGIAVQKNNDGAKATILPGYKTTVTLYDANRQRLDSLEVTTNEYGSFRGSFQLPEGGLNGYFSLSTPNGSVSFRMEEYKRPKFYVDFEKMKGTYKLSESITVTGFAKAYAGNTIDGATVKYRVVRQARFPYPWIFARYWWPMPQSTMEIAHGAVTTAADGKFSISFDAIPDASIDPKTEPVFDYQVYADVTDINGEVRSGNEMVSIGYKSLLIQSVVPKRIHADSLHSLQIRTENMAGQFEKAAIQVAISKLSPEPRLLRTRYWQQPDQFVMTKEEYVKNFPNDIYKNEDDPVNWEKAGAVTNLFGNTDSTGLFKISKLEPGYYIIEITTKDKEDKEVKDVKYTEVYGEQQQPAFPQYLWITTPRSIEPGEKTTLQVGSSANQLFLVQAIDRSGKKFSYLTLNQETKSFDFTATEADRGGYGVSYMFVKNNRIYSANNTISVPWTNKDLKIEYETFRDKTLPGAEEKWSVKLSGYKGEKVAAEMLASMYDASLDQFNPHQWNKPGLWNHYYNLLDWNSNTNFQAVQARNYNNYAIEWENFQKQYDYLFNNYKTSVSIGYGRSIHAIELRNVAEANITGSLQGKIAGISVQANPAPAADEAVMIRGTSSLPNDKFEDNVLYVVDGVLVSGNPMASLNAADIESIEILKDAAATAIYGAKGANGAVLITTKNGVAALAAITPRKNFNETAFFFPDLKTDKNGNISFSFTMPEALTRWKFQALSHTKDLAFGYSSKEIVTQKDLMVQPNAPRFLREGDKMEFSSKVVNVSTKDITAIVSLQLFDAVTNKPIDDWFKNEFSQKRVTIAAGQSQSVHFPIEVPDQFSKAITWRIVAKTTSQNTASLSDGEENMLPVLTNRMLVTETLPLQMRGYGSKKFSFDKLLKSGNSETLSTQALTVEYTSNPAWYAVQALPYMMEYPYECAEQTWNRYYANSLATLIANSTPKIKAVFDTWKTKDTTALLSNLQKNPELKAVLLEETPWVLQAQSETQQKKNMALLFDLVRMSGELSKAYDKLKEMQSPNGGFVWFKGGQDDRYITQYILTGIGHLKKLNAIEKSQTVKLNSIVNAAIPYLDTKIKETYDELIKNKVKLNEYTPSYYVIQYLYIRSFFDNIKIPAHSEKAVLYFRDRAAKTWVSNNKYMQALIALTLHRKGDATTPKAILKSLKETAINNEELGMYFKDANRGWWWYEAPIERQALVIEAFEEIAKDKKTADDLRTWLLKNKQTNNWESTKATAEACYALLLQGTQWLTIIPEVTVDLGGLKIESQWEPTEAGMGYMKKIIPGEKVKPAMGAISVTVAPSDGNKTNTALPTWGNVYWQYFETLDKITSAETPLKLDKKLFVETNGDRGPVLTPVAEGASIKVGDKIKVRIELRVDRDMEYVHMKDMRASSFEPVNVLSTYKWQGGLGYYETTKDASNNFFFSELRKGTYIFEYSLFATVAGNFSNGVTTIQCMYAPEFSSHSEGIRVNVVQ